MEVHGRLAQARVHSPSHRIGVEARGLVLEITGAGRAALDHDLVVQFELEKTLPPSAVVAQDGERWVALAALPVPPAAEAEDQAGRCIPIVIDCSGSKAGDSITLARKALRRILDSLRPQDRFNIICFDSCVVPLFARPRSATPEALARAEALLGWLEADLGGTEIGQALEAAFAARPEEVAQQDVLLITDGEVWESAPVVVRARASGDRVFTVGVGHAVSAAFLEILAEDTGGACGLVAPAEDIAGRIARHFVRMLQPRLAVQAVDWPAAPVRQSPARIERVYRGDTVHLFAWFAEPPSGGIRFVARAVDGPAVLCCKECPTCLRLAGAAPPAECSMPWRAGSDAGARADSVPEGRAFSGIWGSSRPTRQKPRAGAWSPGSWLPARQWPRSSP